MTDGQIKSSSVGAVAVSESNPDIVYIGMGESCIRGNILPGDGVYKSTDAGKTWTHVGFSNSDAISKIRIHPTNPDIVFVADFGKYGTTSDERGVYKIDRRRQDLEEGAVPRQQDRRGRRGYRSSKSQRDVRGACGRRTASSIRCRAAAPAAASSSPPTAAKRGARSRAPAACRRASYGKMSVAISGADSNRVYALVENDKGGLYSSDDGGATWKLINEARSIRQRAFYYTHVHADPNNKDVVYLLNTSAFRSTDGGKTLVSIGNGTHGDHHDLWIDPDDSKHVVLANDGGGAITFNVDVPQRVWSDEDFPTAQFYHVITTKHVPYPRLRRAAGQHDAVHSERAGRTRRRWRRRRLALLYGRRR